jgi:DNA polymerase-3 subunit epsilon
MGSEVVQRSFDDLGTPLVEVTFCVIDLETTGGDPTSDAITEIGAVRVRGGETLATLQTLVNPGRTVPTHITLLTGIHDGMVATAPRIEEVLGTLVDFIGDAVIVGHNVGFDLGFLAAALARDGRHPLTNARVDTVALARRLLRDQVPNCRLDTLAERLGLPHRPSHRALDDALATADLLHVLIERSGRLGVTGLDDLRALPALAGSAAVHKLHLTNRLPRTPGVYLFRGRSGEVLYVGKATNLRARVRQYFASDRRHKVGALLRETTRIDHKSCPTELEAAVLEVRLIHRLRPRFNRVGTRGDRAVYVRFDPVGRFPRLQVVRAAGGSSRAVHLGPIRSRAVAQLVVEATHTALPLRQCRSLPGRSRRTGPCLAAQLGLALCPCTGEVSPERYATVVARTLDALGEHPEIVADPVRARMMQLAAAERFEEAAQVRDRLAAFEDAVARQQTLEGLRAAEQLVVRDPAGVTYRFCRGVLTEIGDDGPGPLGGRLGGMHLRPVEARPTDPGPPGSGPLCPAVADELRLVARWLARQEATLELVSSG